MIIVYPMLVSKAVSENIVPGLTKTIEQFIIVNLKDTIMSNPEVKKKLNLKLKNGRLIATESVNLSEAKDKDWGGRTKAQTLKDAEAEAHAMNDIYTAYKQNEENIKDKLAIKNEELSSKIGQVNDSYKTRTTELTNDHEKLSKEAWDDLGEKQKVLDKINKDIEKAGETRDQILKQIENEKSAAERKAAAELKDAEIQAEKERKEVRANAELKLKQDQFKDDKKERERKRLEDEKKKAEEDEADKKKKAEEEAEKDARAGVSSISMSDNKALSIEPSTIEVNYTDRNGFSKPYSLGVKVIPFRVKSEAKLSRLIMHDTNLKWFSATLISLGRKITRRVWGFVDRWAANLKLGGLIPSGDPRRDIVMSRSGYKGGGYIVLNKTYDIDESFLNNVKKINRLYKMGWGNIIIVDNVNRMAYFCLKEFKGVCTAISFAMIYHNFKALQVYDSLEDATRQSSSIFKIKKQFSKVVAEWIVDYKRAKYLSEDK